MAALSLKSVVESTFDVVKGRSTEHELVILCPEPGCGDRSGNRSVNLKTGKTNCWRCNKGGNFVLWARKLGYELDVVISGSSVDQLIEMLDRKEERVFVPSASDVKLPKGFTPCAEDMDSVYTRLIGKMAVRKNLELKDFVKAGVGFTKADPAWESFAIFPVVEYGRVVYFQGRTYTDEPGEKTKKFPSRSEVPLSAKYWVYGLDDLRKPQSKVAVVVESILNVLSLRKKFSEQGVVDKVPVCVFKHSISKPQAAKIMKCKNVDEICLLFDHDAIQLAWESSSKLSSLMKITIAEMPSTDDNKKMDANDNVDVAYQVIQSRKRADVATSRLTRNILLADRKPEFDLRSIRFDSSR